MSSVVCRQFSLGEIKDATNNFEKVLGHGGEGIVYLGQISAIGRVAVKLLKSHLAEFEEEIEIVSKIKHPHLVSLHGYCEESGQKILVYEYMGKGSLSDYISKKRKCTFCLSWQQRLNICLGAARGLQHLHTETEELPKGIIHRDIKPDNILLDDDWVAKVSDFGMCKLSHAGQKQSTMITLLKGTGGYYAPEYVKYRSITRKIDVYAFGVVLFEVLCRKMPWDRGDESYYGSEDEDLGLWARENVDPKIDGEISEDCLEAFTHIIGRSLQQDPSRRPTMDDVVMDLECALKCQECQDEGIRPKAITGSIGRKVSIPGSARKMIQNIKEMKITENSEDEIYAILKECSMDPIQTIQKLLIKVRISNETTAEQPQSSNTTAVDNDKDITMSVEEMKAFCQELMQATSDSEGSAFNDILKDTDRTVACLTTTVAKTFQFCVAGDSSRPCKYALNSLMQIFQDKRLAHAVKESTLKCLILELLIWLIDERQILGMDDGSQLRKALNVVMLKILDNAERTSSFVALINLLHPLDPSIWTSRPSTQSAEARSTFYDLVVKCLIKITKVLESTILDLNLELILQSIHVFLQEVGWDGISRRAKDDDKPLRMVKTVMHELVKLRGTAIKDHLSMIPIHMEPQPIILAYIDLNIETLTAAGQNHLGDSANNNQTPATSSSDAQLKQELAVVFKKIGDKQTSSIGLYELYRITQLYPKVDVYSYIQNASEAFRTYVRDGLAQIESQQKRSKDTTITKD